MLSDDPTLDKPAISYEVNGALEPVEFGADNVAVITTRFGEMRLDKNNSINFTKGILGVASTKFALVDYPVVQYQQYKILQSIEDARLAFIVMPLERSQDGYFSSFYQTKDIDECLKHLNLTLPSITLLLIVSVNNSEANRISVNLKAPLIIDVNNNIGAQYVFTNNHYEIRHVLKPVARREYLADQMEDKVKIKKAN